LGNYVLFLERRSGSPEAPAIVRRALSGKLLDAMERIDG
jgi:hypothetical protein